MDMSNGHNEQRHNRLSAEPTLASNPHNPNSAAYLAYPVKHVVSSLYRRMTEPPDQPVSRLLDAPVSTHSGYFTPPKRTASPFSPPPLTPLTLQSTGIPPSKLLLTRSLAEEIRLLVPARLQLVDTWRLAYSLESDGASLHTLYQHCARAAARSQRAGYVLVVRDSSPSSYSAIFGAYLSDPPHPALHYYGTGECFLWKASILSSIRLLSSSLNLNGSYGGGGGGGGGASQPSPDLLELAGLPPPPSADTTNLQRTTILLRGEPSPRSPPPQQQQQQNGDQLFLQPPTPEPRSGASTPDRIRFKAFPYSGVNDYMIYCEPEYLSIGGGDGHYGLWLDNQLDHGISDTCPTFGNESLSEEGHKFDMLGVEVWYIGT